ncbi:MAG TPA: sugar transferase [Candidatus Paceibacterota bacterium]|nr:sugar transferase [Candidatus Paceibacterota bacterium]
MRKFTLFILDAGLLYLSLLAMLVIRYGFNISEAYAIHLAPFLIIFGFWLLVFYIAGLYDVRTFRNNIYFYSTFLQAVGIATLVSIGFFYVIPLFGITPKTNLAIFAAAFTLLDIAGRSLFNGIVETRLKKPTLIIGSNELARETADLLCKNPQLGYELVAVIDPAQSDHFEREIRDKRINTVVVSPESYQIPHLIDVFYKTLGMQIAFYNLATFYERVFGRVPVAGITQVWFLENMTRANSRFFESFKRLGDIIFGLVFGAVSLPICGIVALLVRFTSEGPIFYTQTRIGRLGKPFKIVKFRTMVKDAEAQTGAVWASASDARVTPLGRFLRRTRLDELPQFWLVVKGDMSLVGPRAERPEFHSILKKEVPFYEERYLIKPGLSGWAQINYSYGSSIHDAAQKLQYDLYYIKNRSIILDIGIILTTIRIALAQAGN